MVDSTEGDLYKKPHISISYGYNEESRYHLKDIPNSIQLSVFKYDIYEKLKDKLLEELKTSNIDVRVVHLPLDSLKIGPITIMGMMKELYDETGCRKFVIHPNRTIKEFLNIFMENNTEDIILCVENFQWKKKKELKTPLEIIEYINNLGYKYHPSKNIKLCLDTSHTEDLWFDQRILSFILPYVEVIHLSNRIGNTEQHIPFNSGNGDLNLVGFIKEVVSRYNWSGDIVLEYMPVYHHKLFQNASYLKKIIDARY